MGIIKKIHCSPKALNMYSGSCRAAGPESVSLVLKKGMQARLGIPNHSDRLPGRKAMTAMTADSRKNTSGGRPRFYRIATVIGIVLCAALIPLQVVIVTLIA